VEAHKLVEKMASNQSWDEEHTQTYTCKVHQLEDIIRDQVRINDEVGKKIHATDKLLENINAKMDNFTVATQNQLSFNKMLETQI
jgi:hypothetical protein